MDLSDSGQGPLSGCCEYNSQPSDWIKLQGLSWLAGELLASQEDCSIFDSDRICPNDGPIRCPII